MAAYRLIYELTIIILLNACNVGTTSLVNLFSIPVGLCDSSSIG